MGHLLRVPELASAALVAGLWQGLALATVVWLCLRFAPGLSAGTRFAIWSGTLTLLCLLPIVESFLHRPAAIPSNASLLHVDARWSLAGAGAWIALSLIRTVLLVRQALYLRQVGADASPVTPHASLRTVLERGRPVELCISTALDRPGVLGFFHPRILIPAWLYDQLTGQELDQIVLHEIEHLRRRDDWLNLLQKISLVLFPLNPVLLWIDRRLCLERELACDEAVIHQSRSPRSYASCLARLAELGLDRNAPTLALGALDRQSLLARRVYRILRAPAMTSPWRNGILTGMTGAALLAGTMTLARCPQLVSFVEPNDVAAVDASAPPLSSRDLALRTHVPAPTFAETSSTRLVNASLTEVRHAVKSRVKAHKVRVRRQAAPAQRASLEPVIQNLPAEPRQIAAPGQKTLLTPMLVHYQLVPVEGGWLLLQM